MSNQYRPLREEECKALRERFGSNRITEQTRRGFFRQFLLNFRDPIIRILLAALGVNLILAILREGSPLECIGIAAAVLISTLVSTLSEYGSEMAFRRLQSKSGNALCTVERAEGLLRLPLSELVRGDRVHLSPGDTVPADGVLLSGSVTVDQSALNGESAERRKKPAVITPDLQHRGETEDNAQRSGLLTEDGLLSHPAVLLRGSNVTTGEGVMLVRRVGDDTLYGHMAGEMQSEVRDSPLKHRLSQLARMLSRIGYAAACLVMLSDLFCSLFLRGSLSGMTALTLTSHIMHALTLGITVVVVAVPEGLPMMITVVLSSNMLRMVRDHVLVRKLVGIETAGSLNLLFTDKTGTLTRGVPDMISLTDGTGKSYAGISRLSAPLRELYTLSCLFGSSVTVQDGHPVGGNATDRALYGFCLPLKGIKEGAWKRGDVLPFDSAYKYAAASATDRARGRRYLFVRGAPELLLSKCTGYYDADGHICPLTDRRTVEDRLHALTGAAYRVIAICTSPHPVTTDSRFSDLTLIGLAAIRDTLRPEAKRAVAEIAGAGITTVMITGDNRETAAAIARECGILPQDYRLPPEGAPHIPGTPAVLSGTVLAAMEDTEVSTILPDLRVVSRALPADKSRLVRLSQAAGMVTGMTGDGINDAPALRIADVGFSMGSGTDVAREAGDICIRDDNIASIARAILYGRTIFHNIRKFLIFQLTMNLCAVGVSVAGSFIGIDTPVTVMQMLWINLIMDTLAGLAFAGEIPRPEYMREAPKSRSEPILRRDMLWQIALTGGYTVALCVAFLRSRTVYSTFRYDPSELYFLCGFFTLFVFAGLANSFNARTPRLWLFSGILRNPVFLLVIGTAVTVQCLLIRYGGEIFRCVPLNAAELRTVIWPALSVIPFDLLRKVGCRLWRRRKQKIKNATENVTASGQKNRPVRSSQKAA